MNNPHPVLIGNAQSNFENTEIGSTSYFSCVLFALSRYGIKSSGEDKAISTKCREKTREILFLIFVSL